MARRVVQATSVESITVPIGTIIFSPKGTVPSGFLACEGGTFSSGTYPALYAYLGTNVLPDFRDRVARGAGTLAGSAGTTQEDAFQGHWHEAFGDDSTSADNDFMQANRSGVKTLASGNIKGPITDGTNGTPRTAAETRVKAYIGKFIIKAFDVAVNQGEIDVSELATSVQAVANKFSNLSFRNKIINGNFSINQRGVSNATHLQYAADRWVTETWSGTATFNVNSFSLGEIGVFEDKNYLRITVSSAGDVCLRQSIESVRTLAGKTATITFWARAQTPTTLEGILVGQNFGTGGSPSSMAGSWAYPTMGIGTSWTKIATTVDLPSISGKTLGTNGNDHLYFRIDLLPSYTGWVDFAHISIVEGDATAEIDPFSPRSPQQEMALCHRYCRVLGGRAAYEFIGSGRASSTSDANIFVPFGVSMRTNPSVWVSSAAHFFLSGGTPAGSISGDNPMPDGCGLTVTGSSGMTSGGGAILAAANTLSARIIFDAEY